MDREYAEKLFQFAHLPPHLRTTSEPFYHLAMAILDQLPRNPERTLALRKLVEAKDCAVRAHVIGELPPPAYRVLT